MTSIMMMSYLFKVQREQVECVRPDVSMLQIVRASVPEEISLR